MYETKPYFYGTGRRKDSVARVRVYTGTGKITINDRDIDNYFGLETLKLIVRSPLVLLGLEGKYDVVVRVSGGGVSGQAGAIRHGLSRALLQQSDENRPALKKAGFLTRDPRMKERKKYGLKAARRAPQFSKRCSYLHLHLYGSASAEPFFAACFPGEQRGTTAHLRRLPRKGRAGGAKDPCSSIACRAQPCQRCTSVLQALILSSSASLRLCFGRAVFLLQHKTRNLFRAKTAQRRPLEGRLPPAGGRCHHR